MLVFQPCEFEIAIKYVSELSFIVLRGEFMHLTKKDTNMLKGLAMIFLL